MLFSEPLPFIGLYLEKLDKAIKKHKPGYTQHGHKFNFFS